MNELKGLSWIERRLIACISTNTCIIRVHAVAVKSRDLGEDIKMSRINLNHNSASGD